MNDIYSLLQNTQPNAMGMMNPPQVPQGLGKTGSDFFLGTNRRIEQVPTYSPQARQLIDQLLSSGVQGLQNPSAGYEPFAQQARTQFANRTVPSLAERFTSMGGGKLSSPAFASSLGSAAADLEQSLATGAANYGLQNRSSLLSQIGLGLTPQYQNMDIAGQPGALESSIKPLIELLIRAGAAYGTGGWSEFANLLSQFGLNK